MISGPSGVGKNTLLNRFLEQNPSLKLSISVTTRQPRPGEVDGVNYFFITQEQFLDSVENDDFLEWAQFSGNYYGTKKSYVEKTLARGSNLILEIDTQGALQVKSKISDAVLIFISPPSLADLEKRLRGRNTESEEDIQKRLAFVADEMRRAAGFDFTVVNDSIEEALAHLQKIFDESTGT